MIISRRDVAKAALAIALGYAAAGIRESGGNNRGDQVEAFQRLLGGHPGDAWCADFVCSCLIKAHARVRGLPEDRVFLQGYVRDTSGMMVGLSGSCVGLWGSAKFRGIQKPKSFHPSPGDLVLFDFGGTGEPHHVGFVKSAAGEWIYTVEGNTSSGQAGSQADGDGVFERMRALAHVFGFISFG